MYRGPYLVLKSSFFFKDRFFIVDHLSCQNVGTSYHNRTTEKFSVAFTANGKLQAEIYKSLIFAVLIPCLSATDIE